MTISNVESKGYGLYVTADCRNLTEEEFNTMKKMGHRGTSYS